MEKWEDTVQTYYGEWGGGHAVLGSDVTLSSEGLSLSILRTYSPKCQTRF